MRARRVTHDRFTGMHNFRLGLKAEVATCELRRCGCKDGESYVGGHTPRSWATINGKQFEVYPCSASGIRVGFVMFAVLAGLP